MPVSTAAVLELLVGIGLISPGSGLAETLRTITPPPLIEPSSI
jgi:hypothetical protein